MPGRMSADKIKVPEADFERVRIWCKALAPLRRALHVIQVSMAQGESAAIEPSSPWTDDSGPNIIEIIHDPKAIYLLTPANLGILLTKCPIYQLERAWKYIATPCKYPPTAAEISTNQWLRAWTPVTFKDPASRTYHRYHPVLLETGTKLYYVVCFDQSAPQDKSLGINNFIALPPLNFLPPGCDKVIAGSAGLLVLDGGDQPGDNPILLWGQAQIPNHKYWQDAKVRVQSGGQSMVCVTNPLTREFILLPPIPNRRLHGKMAKLVFHNMARTKYHLVIAGWDMKKKNNKVEDVLCVIVYSSEKQCFVHANYIERARPIPYHECGRSGLAVINYCVYFGGMRVIERIDQNEDIYIPAVYYFNISENRRQCLCFDFTLVNMAGRQVQAPKVVQAGPDRVFAVTRYAQIPTIIWIVEVNLQPDGTPTGTYKKVPRGVMPSLYYQKLFPTEEEALLPYEFTNADNKIAFKVQSERNLIVMYDMNSYEWRICEYPAQNGQKEFQLCDGCYEPVFTARP